VVEVKKLYGSGSTDIDEMGDTIGITVGERIGVGDIELIYIIKVLKNNVNNIYE
jgi:hypothetical protein